MTAAAPILPQNPIENPLATDGFEFVEFAAHDPAPLVDLFSRFGFAEVAQHRHKNVRLFQQGQINFIINSEPNSPASQFAALHGNSACAMAFRVGNAAKAMTALSNNGCKALPSSAGAMELNIPAIEGIGGSALYLIDRYGKHSIYDVDFDSSTPKQTFPAAGLGVIDHLTHNVHQGRMDYWAEFYQRNFNFREIRYFDIEGNHTGLRSRAMTSPCGKIRIPINESADDKSQIAEYLRDYNGEGIQHIALSSNDIVATVKQLKANGIEFCEAPPATYYDGLDRRLPNHGQDLRTLRELGILLDGDGKGKLLLQIFTRTLVGPIFFEIIQRRGDEGFGEGNFKALFVAMEEDQIRRGVLETGQK